MVPSKLFFFWARFAVLAFCQSGVIVENAGRSAGKWGLRRRTALGASVMADGLAVVGDVSWMVM